MQSVHVKNFFIIAGMVCDERLVCIEGFVMVVGVWSLCRPLLNAVWEFNP